MTLPDQKFAIALGAAGALVEVTDYVLFNEGDVAYKWGQDRRFDDPVPGTFSLTLKNEDGRFTPDNPTSPYPLTLVEGMQVVWEFEGRLVEGTIRAGGIQIIFPTGGNADSARVRVTCDDVLGKLARDMDDLPLWSRYLNENADYHWEFGGPDGTTEVFDGGGSGIAFRLVGDQAAAQWGQTPPNDNYFTNGVRMNADPDVSAYWVADLSSVPLAYGWHIQVTISDLGTTTALPRLIEVEDTYGGVIQTKLGSTGVASKLVTGGTTTDLPAPSASLRLYFNGSGDWVVLAPAPPGVVVAGTSATHRPNKIRLLMDGAPATLFRVAIKTAGFGSSPSVPAQTFGNTAATVEDRLDLIAALSDVAVAGESGFSGYQVGLQDGRNESTLTQLSDVLRVEGGAIFPSTSGTLTSPTTQVTARPKVLARSQSVKYTLSMNEINDQTFARDIANMVSTVNASSGTTAVRVVNEAAQEKVGPKSATLYAPAYDPGILRNIAEDRIFRGADTRMQLLSFTVDTRSIGRLTDILGTTPGDRIRITDIPSQVGRSTVDVWFIGASELHSTERDNFTFYVEPALDAFVYDTAVYGAGGTLTLSSSCTSSATSLSVATTSAKFTTTNLPQNIIVDREIMTVTAADSGTPQTLTVTRAQSGTLAFAHASGAEVEIAPTSVYSF